MQIMKGYHCSSDNVNLRVLHSVCLWLSYAVPCAANLSTAGMDRGCCTVPSTHFLPRPQFV